MSLLNRLLVFLRSRRLDREMDEELRAHLARETEQNVARGMAPDEARFAALRAFGGVEQIKERARDARGILWLEDLWRDVRFAAQMLRRSPGFTAVAVLTLALGIGANTAIFSVVHGVLLRPLPYPEQDRLVSLQEATASISSMPASYADVLDWRRDQRSFTAIGVARGEAFNIVGAGEAESVEGAKVSHDLFSVLGFTPLQGRLFTADDDRPGTERTVIVGAGLGRRFFPQRDSVVGEKLRLSGETYTIIGVLPEQSRLPFAPSEVWVPFGLSLDGSSGNRSNRFALETFARLKPGATIESARADLGAVADRLAKDFPASNAGVSVLLQPVIAAGTGEVRTTLYVLLGAAAFVLLIACANVANLQLARTRARAHEFALRGALGAGRARVVRQLLVESLVLGLLGCTAGVILGGWAIDVLRTTLPSGIPRLQEIGFNGWVLTFAIGASLLTSLGFGLFPAIPVARQDLRAALAQDHRTGDAAAGHRWRATLIAGEFALTCTLLVGAGLMIRTLGNLHRADPGFKTERLVTFHWRLTGQELWPEPARGQLLERARERLLAVPGVTSVAHAFPLPLDPLGDMQICYYAEGTPLPEAGKAPLAYVAWVGGDFFTTFGINLIAGRTFGSSDVLSSPRVAIVDTTFAATHFPGANPVGRRITANGGPPAKESGWYEIVGVVPHIENLGFGRSPRPQVYLSAAQSVPWATKIVVRTEGDPATSVPLLRAAMREVAGHLPIASVRTMDELFAVNIARQRLMVLLLGGFSGLALLLAAVGLYGVLSYSVGQRTREIGVRMALGATRKSVVRLVLGDGLKFAALGLALGLGAAFGLTQFLQGVLFGVSVLDPVSFAAVAVLLVGIGAVACWIPAYRAANVDPMIALRSE